jgi:hypothetical protein
MQKARRCDRLARNTANPVVARNTMSTPDSSRTTPARKPTKPYPDFPLFAHAVGQWAKKIRGKLHYFGVWADPDGALAKYLEQKDALHAGRKPRETSGELAVKDVANQFLSAKTALVDAGELSPRTWAGYKLAVDEMVSQLGKSRLVADLDPSDFASMRARMAKKWGPHRLATTIQVVRSVFKHAYYLGMKDALECHDVRTFCSTGGKSHGHFLTRRS